MNIIILTVQVREGLLHKGDVVHFQTHQVNYMLPYLPEDIHKLKVRAVRLKCDGHGSIRYWGETRAL